MTIASSAGTALPPIPPAGASAPAATTTNTTAQGGAAASGCSDSAHATSGGGAADAAAGANALGGGDPMAGIVQALKGIVEALSKLVALLASGTTGSGPATKGGGGEPSTAAMLGAGSQPAAPVSDVAGASGGGHAPTQKTQVGGAQGPAQVPTQMPTQVPTQKTQVGGAQGPVQLPTQVPTQSPLQKSPVQTDVAGGGAVQGDVVLDEGALNSVKLTSGAGNSVRMWGDPHVELSIDGTARTFDIGYGPGGVELSDGTRISWDTTAARKEVQNFRIDRPGTEGDVQVNADDRTFERNLQTYLDDTQLREFAAALEQYEGPALRPLAAANQP